MWANRKDGPVDRTKASRASWQVLASRACQETGWMDKWGAQFLGVRVSGCQQRSVSGYLGRYCKLSAGMVWYGLVMVWVGDDSG